MPITDANRIDPSETQLGNLALGLLGARQINSFTDGTTESNAVQKFYYDVRDELFEEYDWDFAIVTAVLTTSTTVPAFNRDNAFAVPSDWLRTLPPFPEVNMMGRDWIQQKDPAGGGGVYIFTNDQSPLNFRYVAQISDVTRFPPSFRKALQFQLAYRMCEEITQSNSKKADMLTGYEKAIANAKRLKAIQKVAQDPATDDWLTVRDSGLGGPQGWFNF